MAKSLISSQHGPWEDSIAPLPARKELLRPLRGSCNRDSGLQQGGEAPILVTDELGMKAADRKHMLFLRLAVCVSAAAEQKQVQPQVPSLPSFLVSSLQPSLPNLPG